MVSHHFKSLSPNLSHTIPALHSQWTSYFDKKIEVIVQKLLVRLCDSLQHQTATSIIILSSNLKGSGVLPAIQGKAWIWFYSLSLMLKLLPLIFLYPLPSIFSSLLTLFLQPIHALQTSIQKGKSTNKSRLTSPFTWFHRRYHPISLLPSSFRLSIAAVYIHYLQRPRFRPCSAQCDLISNPI